MGRIMVTIIDVTNRQTTVEVPDDKPIRDVVQKLGTMLDWPQQGGRVVLHHKREGLDLDDSKTLGEQRVTAHDVLKVRIDAIPGSVLGGGR